MSHYVWLSIASGILLFALACGGDGSQPRTKPRVDATSTPEPLRAYRVDSLSDRFDEIPGDGVCGTPAPRECTLHAAIQEALASEKPLPITFAVSGTVALGSALPPLSKGILIDGPGAQLLTVVAPPGSPVVQVAGAAEIRGLTLTGGTRAGIIVDAGAELTTTRVTISGNTAGGNVFREGGGVRNQGKLNLNSSVVAQNTAHFGAGIMNQGALVVDDSQIRDNRAEDDPRGVNGGGGIASGSREYSVTIRNSRLTGNRAGNGGAIYSFGDLLVENSLIAENSVPSAQGVLAHGGGLYLGGTARVVNSHIVGNVASYGGGIFKNPDANLEITGSAIAFNRASTSGGGIVNNRGPLLLERSTIDNNQGGGVFNNRGTATLSNVTLSTNLGVGFQAVRNTGVAGEPGQMRIVHSTITGNSVGVLSDFVSNLTFRASILAANSANCAGLPDNLTSEGANFSSDGTCGLGAAGDRNRTDALLAPLADNGGGTYTHALRPGSPAIDAAGPCDLPTDQRGVTRPQSGLPGAIALCDAGSYELQPAPLP